MQQIFLKPDVWTFFFFWKNYSSVFSRSPDGKKWNTQVQSIDIVRFMFQVRSLPRQLTHHSLFMHILPFPQWLVPLCYRYPMALWEGADHIGNSMPRFRPWSLTANQARQLVLDTGTYCVTADGNNEIIKNMLVILWAYRNNIINNNNSKMLLWVCFSQMCELSLRSYAMCRQSQENMWRSI